MHGVSLLATNEIPYYLTISLVLSKIVISRYSNTISSSSTTSTSTTYSPVTGHREVPTTVSFNLILSIVNVWYICVLTMDNKFGLVSIHFLKTTLKIELKRRKKN